jgi:hypothetical protein
VFEIDLSVYGKEGGVVRKKKEKTVIETQSVFQNINLSRLDDTLAVYQPDRQFTYSKLLARDQLLHQSNKFRLNIFPDVVFVRL